MPLQHTELMLCTGNTLGKAVWYSPSAPGWNGPVNLFLVYTRKKESVSDLSFDVLDLDSWSLCLGSLMCCSQSNETCEYYPADDACIVLAHQHSEKS